MKISENLQRTENLVKQKANEIKRLQTQLMYYKNKKMKAMQIENSNEANDEDHTENNVK